MYCICCFYNCHHHFCRLNDNAKDEAILRNVSMARKECKKKIRALTDIAQMKVRENFEHGTPLRFDKEDSVYAELKNGNFIETLPYERKCCVDCKLEEWVLKCFKRYPDLVKELQEMDEAFREADRNFV